MGELGQITYYINGLKSATKIEVEYQAPDTLEQSITHVIRYDTTMFGMVKKKNQQVRILFTFYKFHFHFILLFDNCGK